MLKYSHDNATLVTRRDVSDYCSSIAHRVQTRLKLYSGQNLAPAIHVQAAYMDFARLYEFISVIEEFLANNPIINYPIINPFT